MQTNIFLNFKIVFIIFILALNSACSKSNYNSYPYNERDAFCRDKLSVYNSNYINAKIYNSCMSEADNLIRKFENEAAEWRAESEKRRIEWENEKKEREKQIQQQILNESKKEMEQLAEKENKQKQIDNLFKEKFDKPVEEQEREMIENLFN